MVFMIIDIAERQAQIAQAEDALRNAVRVGVQSYRYRYFAERKIFVREDTATERARQAFSANLALQRGAIDSIDAITWSTRWHPLPQGGEVVFSNGERMSFSRPALCGEVQIRLKGSGIAFPHITRWIRACAQIQDLGA